MPSPDIFARLLDMGLRSAFDEVELLPGASVHNEVLWLADGGLRSLLSFFETISVGDRPGFIKAVAVYENTVGGLGSVTTLQKLLPLVDDGGGELLDWILRNTRSYWYYSYEASSLEEMNEIRREREQSRERAFGDDANRHADAVARKATQASANLYNAVRRGDVNAVRALIAKGADPTTPTPDGDSLINLAIANDRLDIAAELQSD